MIKRNYQDQKFQDGTEGTTKFGSHTIGAVPILVCDILHIVQSLNLKSMGDHTFLEYVVVTGNCGVYTQLEIWNGS